MTLPVQLSDLDLATTANDTDLALIRKDNTTDYKVTVQVLRNIAVQNLPDLSPTANSPLSTDLMLVSRSGANCKCVFSSIGLLAGTNCWFYQNTAPIGWTIVPNLSDSLLAVKGGSIYSTGGTKAGTWQQANHTLTIDQIPSHSHTVYSRGAEEASGNKVKGYRSNAGGLDTWSTNPTGGGLGHNHGSSWRPQASIGIICQKTL